jgi:hypothetical protein
MSNVPLLNFTRSRLVIEYTAAQMLVRCDCGASVMIPGLDRAGQCQGCDTKYVIAALNYTNSQGHCHLEASVGTWDGPMAASFALDLPKQED